MARTTFSRNEIKRKRGESRGEEKKAEPKDAGVDRREKRYHLSHVQVQMSRELV
jgi:hypothetical protein